MKRIIAIIIFIALGLSTVFTNETSASTSDIQADESFKFDKLQKKCIIYTHKKGDIYVVVNTNNIKIYRTFDSIC